MAEVERLMIASIVRSRIADPSDIAMSGSASAGYFAELGRRFDDGYDPIAGVSTTLDDFAAAGLFLLAACTSEPVGCGGLKLRADGSAEIKRMWVAPSGAGSASAAGCSPSSSSRPPPRRQRLVRLETNRNLAEAISMYRSAGYREVPAFNDEPYAHHWFEKAL